MESSLARAFACTVLLSLTLACGPAGSAESDPPILQEVREIIDGLERDRLIALVLATAAGIVGIIIAALQALQRAWVKAGTILLGVVVSICTLLNTQLFESDHRELGNKTVFAKRMQKEIERLHEELKALPTGDAENRKALNREIRKHYNLVMEIRKSTFKEPASAALPLAVALAPISAAHAQSPTPAWVQDVSKDADRLEFVGVADSRLLDDAAEASRRRAIDEAVAFLRAQLSKDQASRALPPELPSYLAEAGTITDRHFTRDPKTGLFRYYTKFSISKRTLESSLRFFSVENKVPIPRTTARVLAGSSRAPGDYVQRRQDSYTEALNLERQTLDPADVERFNKARAARKVDATLDSAIATLEALTAKYPDFYMGWYNFALAYGTKREKGKDDTVVARKEAEAYERALAAAVAKGIKDPSLHNSYGVMLLSTGRPKDAVVQLERALALEPQHPSAAVSLETARAQAQR